MALLPLHRFSNGAVDETVDAFALSFCVLLDLGFPALLHANFDLIIMCLYIFFHGILLSFRNRHVKSSQSDLLSIYSKCICGTIYKMHNEMIKKLVKNNT